MKKNTYYIDYNDPSDVIVEFTKDGIDYKVTWSEIQYHVTNFIAKHPLLCGVLTMVSIYVDYCIAYHLF